jgi:hypothetical protein
MPKVSHQQSGRKRRKISMNVPKTVSISKALPVRLVDQWRPALDFYPADELTELSFDSDCQGDKAVELLHSSELAGCPYTFTLGGGIVIPTEAVHVFRREKLNFVENRL